MGLHERAAQIYEQGEVALSADEIPSTADVELAFNGAMEWLHTNRVFGGAMLKEKPVLNLVNSLTDYLSKGIEQGISVSSPSELLVSRLKESAGVFSGFKTFHEMNEAASMLLDEKGNIKPFEHFLNDVQTINKEYNESYLRSEYNFAVLSSEKATRWEELSDDGGGRYLLQYRTANDDKVRESHAELHGITLAPSDPFWESYYPPNGWWCRCTVVKVRASKYPATDSSRAATAGEGATSGKYADMFRFNAGKQRTSFPAHNSYTISECSTCTKNSLELAKIPNNDLCAACPIIRKCAGDRTKSQATIERIHYAREMEHLLKKKSTFEIGGERVNIGFRKNGNSHLYSDTFGRSSVLTKEHLKDLDKVLERATYIRSAELSKVRDKDDIVRFHYLRSDIDGKDVYLNVAEVEEINKRGKKWRSRYVYSITDRLKK